jgi:hypothetical protein
LQNKIKEILDELLSPLEKVGEEVLRATESAKVVIKELEERLGPKIIGLAIARTGNPRMEALRLVFKTKKETQIVSGRKRKTRRKRAPKLKEKNTTKEKASDEPEAKAPVGNRTPLSFSELTSRLLFAIRAKGDGATFFADDLVMGLRKHKIDYNRAHPAIILNQEISGLKKERVRRPGSTRYVNKYTVAGEVTFSRKTKRQNGKSKTSV